MKGSIDDAIGCPNLIIKKKSSKKIPFIDSERKEKLKFYWEKLEHPSISEKHCFESP